MDKLIWAGIAVFVFGTFWRAVAAVRWYKLARRRVLSPEQTAYYRGRYRRQRLIGLGIIFIGFIIVLLPSILDKKIETV